MTMKYFKDNLSKNEQVAQNLFILKKDGRKQVNTEEIIYIQAHINYSTFYTRTQQFTTAFHLGFFEQSLQEQPNFVRISKSYLINLNFLADLNWNQRQKAVQLSNGISLPISRRKAKQLKDTLWDKLNVTN
jgi:two-component system, LytTR family, response regulator